MSTSVSLNALSSNFIEPSSIATYASYQFTTPALLEVDSSSSNNTLINTGGTYVLDNGKNSLLLKTNNSAIIPSANWSTYNDLAISCWLKTTNFADNDTIFNFEIPTAVAFNTSTINMLAWHKFDSNLTNTVGNVASSLTITAGTSFGTPYDATNKQEGTQALNSTTTGTGFLASNANTPTAYTVNNIPFSIAFWVRITNFTTGNQAIFCIGAGTTNNSVVFGGFVSASVFNFTFGGNNLTCNAGSGNFAANTWYHIACVFNFTNKLRYIYVNGVLVTNDTIAQTAPTHTTAAGYFRIGKPAQIISGATYNSFIGQLDDFRIYNRVLTNKEINIIYTKSTNLEMQLLNSGKLTFIQDGWNAYQATANPLNNTWTHVLWIIKSSAYTNSVIRFNNNIGTQITYVFNAPYSGTYTNTLGNASNSASSSLYISDFRILTIPLTNAIEDELYNPLSTIYTKIFTSDFFDNAINYINNEKQNANIGTASRVLVSDTSGIITTSTVDTTELNYLANVTSDIQTQLNSKQNTITGAATSIVSSDLAASKVLISDASGKITTSIVNSSSLNNKTIYSIAVSSWTLYGSTSTVITLDITNVPTFTIGSYTLKQFNLIVVSNGSYYNYNYPITLLFTGQTYNMISYVYHYGSTGSQPTVYTTSSTSTGFFTIMTYSPGNISISIDSINQIRLSFTSIGIYVAYISS